MNLNYFSVQIVGMVGGLADQVIVGVDGVSDDLLVLTVLVGFLIHHVTHGLKAEEGILDR